MNKKKIINDPVYGFITIQSDLIYDLIAHPYFQRLRNIKQLGMTHLVYPGAVHTRFHHALGAMHLMNLAIETLRWKGHHITEEEEEGAKVAILLHDIGHGPYSHALENTIVNGISHENISMLMMNNLNKEFDHKLDLAIQIFQNTYSKPFLHQLVSGQLDTDRMDYLNRDSFFTGVSEGIIGFDRIIKMLNIYGGSLVVEEKGVYSVEKFLVARRIMYWQVYLHKTSVSAEHLLVNILRKAKSLSNEGHDLFATPSLHHFLTQTITKKDFEENPLHLHHFSNLDDHDIYSAVKVWVTEKDSVLSQLCNNLLTRSLYHVEISHVPFSNERVERLKQEASALLNIENQDIKYFVFTDTITNHAYKASDGSINILMKDGTINDITAAADNSILEGLSKTVKKHILCYTKELNNAK
ncbi:Deoxyguanosinetriphosphate triphosphohydrolase [Arcticibacter svalbardensis MN12-7]|uniref:Deoxyguanosinetriphosphate triphosphohydrolase n=1 Tax=Arcticibacter svalbardensis MN12-7 TaxID=1150600 RepID=R9GRF3_9SPHI|nr:HD domain-containing protein [Arcticibacter svalbardensis]EOR94427.1 Deoxyguanosinetriphosphate triphosphohydrolase [Arcticibacter svalbardensis MN12-7]